MLVEVGLMIGWSKYVLGQMNLLQWLYSLANLFHKDMKEVGLVEA